MLAAIHPWQPGTKINKYDFSVQPITSTLSKQEDHRVLHCIETSYCCILEAPIWR